MSYVESVGNAVDQICLSRHNTYFWKCSVKLVWKCSDSRVCKRVCAEDMIISDVCLKAKVSPRGNENAASASPRRFDALLRSCLGLASVPMLWFQPRLSFVSSALPQLQASEHLKLRCDIMIHIWDSHQLILYSMYFSPLRQNSISV